MKDIKILLLSLSIICFFSCENDALDELRERDDNTIPEVPLEDFTQGNADFSKFVSIGNSLTAGFAANALYKISQENSLPAIMAGQFAKVANGGEFAQPLTNDNVGGLLAGGAPIPGFGSRLVFDGSGPTAIENLNPLASPTTDIILNNPTGPFNNLAVPGARSYHLLAPGYGNLANLPLGLANPYFVRMASSPNATMLEDLIAQQPSFVFLWIGNNDVLGYATTGGDGSSPITPIDGPPGVGFTQTYETIVNSIVGGVPGVQGVLVNIPDVTSIPFFTTVPHNPLSPADEDFGPLIPTLNTLFGALNEVFDFLNVPERKIVFSETSASPIVILDESLQNLSTEITQVLLGNPDFPAFLAQFGLPPEAAPQVAALFGQFYGQARQATEEDLVVLTSLSSIGQVNTNTFNFLVSQNFPPDLAAQFSTIGITLPVGDNLILIPEEQEEIAEATDAYNTLITNLAATNNFALYDAKAGLEQLANGGVETNGLILTSDLVTGGAFSLDGVHPNSRGYAFIANEMLKEIDKTYGTNFEASGNLVDVASYNTNYSPALIE